MYVLCTSSFAVEMVAVDYLRVCVKFMLHFQANVLNLKKKIRIRRRNGWKLEDCTQVCRALYIQLQNCTCNALH